MVQKILSVLKNKNKFISMNFFKGLMIVKKLDEKKHVIFLKSHKKTKQDKDLKKAIFFDRDGVLIKDAHYIKDIKNVSLLKGVTKLLDYTKSLGYLNIVITNQSGISRNFFSWEDYEKVTNRMLEIINLPNTINAIYANGEGPNELTSNKSWRKPNPSMIIKASEDFNIDLSKSILIGDRLSDMQSGEKAGIKNLVHVLTGHGHSERKKVIENYGEANKSLNLLLINDLSFLQKVDF